MKTRSIVAIAAVAGFAAAASANDFFNISWQVNAFDVATGDIVATNVSTINLDQGAEFVASWEFGPAIGTSRTNHVPLTGPVSGFAAIFGDFRASAGHDGTFAGATGQNIFDPGTPQADQLFAVQQAQIGIVGMPLGHSQNTMADAIKIRWTPNNWDNRTVDFDFVKSTATDFAATLYLQANPIPTWTTYRIDNANFDGGSSQINVIPAPSSLALLGLGGLIAARRRRR